jgi:predicted ATPase
LNRRLTPQTAADKAFVKEELAHGGSALPWVDKIAFARRAITMPLADRAAAYSLNGWGFFDRGLIDAAADADLS